MKGYIDADALLQPIFVERERRDTRMTAVVEHVHRFYELYFLCDGQIDKFITDRTYHLKPLDFVIISPGTLHRSLLCKDFRHERIVLYFDERTVRYPKILARLDELKGVIALPNEAALRVFQLLNLLLQEKGKDEWHAAYVSSLVCEILVLTLRNIGPPAAAYAGVKFEQIIDYVREECLDHISLAEVARRFYVSAAHLSRLFKRNTGFTFTQYVNYQRIIHAQNLLMEGKLSIGEVASASGFENLTHFGRVFKQLTGMSPREYKKK